jgi:hypothetical protein
VLSAFTFHFVHAECVPCFLKLFVDAALPQLDAAMLRAMRPISAETEAPYTPVLESNVVRVCLHVPLFMQSVCRPS